MTIPSCKDTVYTGLLVAAPCEMRVRKPCYLPAWICFAVWGRTRMWNILLARCLMVGEQTQRIFALIFGARHTSSQGAIGYKGDLL